MHEYLVLGRGLPSERDPKPKIYRMQVFAPNALVAKSKFWYFLKRLRNIKRAHGEIISCTEVFERKPTTVKNFGVWLRYDSRSGTHNMYKEYRELSRADAIAACCASDHGSARDLVAHIGAPLISSLCGASFMPNLHFKNGFLSLSLLLCACRDPDQDMAARHRARFRSVQIIRIAQIEKASQVKRPYIQQFIVRI